MVDNVTLNSGTGGATLAADDIAGIHHQRVKVQHGADGSATDVSTASPLPVDLRTDNLAGNLDVNLAAAAATVTVDGSGVTQPISAATLPLPTGAATAAAQLSDGHNVTVDNGAGVAAVNIQDGGNSITIDGTVTANAGSGTLTVDGSGVTQPISAAALPLPTGAATAAAQLADGHNVTIDNAAGAAAVNIQDGGNSITIDGSVSGTGTFTVDGSGVTQPISAAALPLPTGAATAANQLADGHNVTVDNASGASAVNIQDGGNSITIDGTVTANLAAGTNNIGDVDVLSVAAGSNLVGDVGIGVRTSGGTTLYKNIDVDESEDQIKGTAGQVYWIHAMNLSAAVKFLKFYNATAASVTVGTTVPDLTFPLPTQGDTNGAGFTLSIPNGIAFGTAITIAATTGVADNDSGAPGANEVIVNLGYA